MLLKIYIGGGTIHIKQYVVDAFTEEVFKGNSAAVCIMDEWIAEELMMSIAIENNLSETAFAVKEENHYHHRHRNRDPGDPGHL